MKRIFMFLAVFLACTGVSAQIPTEYTGQQKDLVTRYVEQLKEDFDIVIPVEERMPISPSSYSLATGNWGAEWSGANRYYSNVFDRAQRPVTVFIFDTAPTFSHPMLTQFAWNELGKSYTGEPTFEDGNGHAHHVAGIIGALSDQYEIGVARALVEKGLLKGVPIEVLNDDGAGSYSWIAKAIEEAIPVAKDLQSKGHFVIFTMSLGGPGTHGATDAALKKAVDAGVFCLAASGNTYGEGLQFPANSAWTHAIGAITNQGVRANFSTYGEGLWVGAPGQNILSTYPGGGLVELSGTSMATPSQAAIVAIAASIFPTASAGQIDSIVTAVSTDISPTGWDKETGWGYDYIGLLLDARFDPVPDDPDPVPDDPTTEDPTKGRRAIRAIIPGPYSFVYNAGGGLFKEVRMENIVIDFKTRKYSEDALVDINREISGFFTSRAITLTKKGDALRAGYWAGRFLEIHLKKRGIKSDFINANVKDERGNIGQPEIPLFWDYFTPSKRTTFRY